MAPKRAAELPVLRWSFPVVPFTTLTHSNPAA